MVQNNNEKNLTLFMKNKCFIVYVVDLMKVLILSVCVLECEGRGEIPERRWIEKLRWQKGGILKGPKVFEEGARHSVECSVAEAIRARNGSQNDNSVSWLTRAYFYISREFSVLIRLVFS